MTLLSLFDHSGNASCPYKESGWKVIQVDIKLGIDILTFDYKSIGPVHGIIAMVPCTDYALSGARHFAAKDKDGRTEQSQKLIAKTKEIIDYFSESLLFWQLENPMSRIHKLNTWLGSPALKFNPCDYAGYDPVPDNSRYNKMTWIWGKFNKPELRRLEPLQVENPGWKIRTNKRITINNTAGLCLCFLSRKPLTMSTINIQSGDLTPNIMAHTPMENKTAMQEIIRQLNGAIQIIDEHGKLNDYAQCRKEVYESLLDIATSLLPQERQMVIDAYNDADGGNIFPVNLGEQYFNNKYKK